MSTDRIKAAAEEGRALWRKFEAEEALSAQAARQNREAREMHAATESRAIACRSSAFAAAPGVAIPSVALPLRLRLRGGDAWIEDANGREAVSRTGGFESGAAHERWLRWIVRAANSTARRTVAKSGRAHAAGDSRLSRSEAGRTGQL